MMHIDDGLLRKQLAEHPEDLFAVFVERINGLTRVVNELSSRVATLEDEVLPADEPDEESEGEDE